MNSILVSNRVSQGDVIVAFSARDTEPGKFTFFSILAQVKANVIFVNDYSNGWYLNGTPEFDDEAALLKYLSEQISVLRHPTQGRIFTLGSSMGAYAALKYGSLLGADKVIAMGPESELCIPLGRSVTSIPHRKEGDCSIYDLKFKDPAAIYIFSGSNDIVDYYCACKMAHANPRLNINIITNRTHVVAKYLNAQFGLENIIQSLFFNDNDSFLKNAEIGVVVPPEIATDIKMFNQKLSKGMVDTSYSASIARAVELFPAWSMIHYFNGLIHEKDGDRNAALSAMRAALEAQENLGRARLKLAALLCEDHHYSAAKVELEGLVESVASYSVYSLLATVHEKQGDIDGAISTLQQVLKTDINSKQKSQAEARTSSLLIESKNNGFSASQQRHLQLARSVIADLDLMSFNYSELLQEQHPQIGITHLTGNRIFCKELHPDAEIQIDFNNSRGSRIFLGHGLNGRIRINITGNDCIVYIGSNAHLQEVQISVNQRNSIAVIGDDVTALQGNIWNCGGGVVTGSEEAVAPLIIGDDCLFSSNVGIFSSDGHPIFSKDGTHQLNRPSAAVLIEPHAWFGHGVTVLKNSTVGACSVIEAGSVVKGNLPRCSMAFGVPAVVHREFDGLWVRSDAPEHLQRALHYLAAYAPQTVATDVPRSTAVKMHRAATATMS